MTKANFDQWRDTTNLEPIKIICGHCGQHVGLSKGYIHQTQPHRIYICSFCGLPTLMVGDDQAPGPFMGRQINQLPENIATIYSEIRDSIKNGAYSGSILLSRKLIMHLAVEKAQANERDSFVNYITALKDAHYIPPNGEKMLDFIRNLGNDQTHEIRVGNLDEATKVLKFVESLLIFMIEMPAEFEGKDLAQNLSETKMGK
jgi:hypothetical protein